MSQKLPIDKFLESLELAPRLVVELVIQDSQGRILLLLRDREPFKGHWHLPGGFLLKDETIADCIKRLGREETDSELIGVSEYQGLFENINGDPRGHLLHYVTKLHVDNIQVGQYFSILPANIIPYQHDFLEKIGF